MELKEIIESEIDKTMKYILNLKIKFWSSGYFVC